MESAYTPDPSLQIALQAVCKALKSQYIQEFAAIQVKLKMLQGFERMEAFPASFLSAWKNIQHESTNEQEATAQLAIEVQNFLIPARQSQLH